MESQQSNPLSVIRHPSPARVQREFAIAGLIAGLAIWCGPTSYSQDMIVRDDAELNAAFRRPLLPGTTVRIAPGVYRGCHTMKDQAGRPGAPIRITALELNQPPVFTDSRTEGIKVIGCSHLLIDHLRFENIRDIGLHVAGGSGNISFSELSPSHHICIADVTILDTGNAEWGNHDAIKIARTDHFVVRNAVLRGWGAGGGSAIDVVGCQAGIIEGCHISYPDRRPNGNDSGITLKGGSRDILVQRNILHCAGGEAIQIGQDTGLKFFRDPPGTTLSDGTVMTYEARNVEVAGNWIVDTPVAVMWMKSENSHVHHNTIVLPGLLASRCSVFKITRAENKGLLRARQAFIADNLIVYRYAALRTDWEPFVRGVATDNPNLTSFHFTGNAWFQLDAQTQPRCLPDHVGRLGLPTAESNPVYQIDPELPEADYTSVKLSPADLRVQSCDPRLKTVGADAYRSEVNQ